MTLIYTPDQLDASNDIRKKRIQRAMKKGIRTGRKCIICDNKKYVYEIINLFWGSYDNDDDVLIANMESKICNMGWNALSKDLTLLDDTDQMQLTDFI